MLLMCRAGDTAAAWQDFYSLRMQNFFPLTKTAETVLQKRYLLRDENGNVAETIDQMFRRVAKNIAIADRNYGKNDAEVSATEEKFYSMLSKMEFLAGMSLYNAGKKHQLLSACFVLPIEDSMDKIFETLHDTAMIHKFAGGVGYDFSHLRPKGDLVSTTGKPASGPISFMRLYDFSGKVVVGEASVRRPANMGMLRIDHPDILEFIHAKKKFDELNTFNISVSATDEFMSAVKEDREYALIHPVTKKETKRLRAREVFDIICESAHASAEPGMVFIDRVNAVNPTPKLGLMEATNPCGEQPLFPYEPCNLGSLVLSKMIRTRSDGQREVDWDKLREGVRNAVHYLDNTIDVSYYPLEKIRQMSVNNRRIGLGIMGFADMLIELGISYVSDEAVQMAEKVMKFVNDTAHEMSQELAFQRGSFPNFPGSRWEQLGFSAMRNCALTTIAPTGTISILANCSSGCEPVFALVYIRKNILDQDKDEFTEVHPLFERYLKDSWLYSQELLERVAQEGSVQHIPEIPQQMKKIFITANDMDYQAHVRIQAAFQKYTDNGVSKTINMPSSATVQDVKNAYMLAYDLGCKGVTVYRDSSRDKQVLNLKSTVSAPAETSAAAS